MKKWTGRTGWSGIETKTCNCPRQPEFHAYLREVSQIYAGLGFARLWIDDDLRIANHQPSDSFGRRIGCWWSTCLKEFNAETGAQWTYYSRSPQGVLVEGFTALMYGMNAVSFFVSNGTKEDPEQYGRTF